MRKRIAEKSNVRQRGFAVGVRLGVFRIILILSLGARVLPAAAQNGATNEPPKQPILRIEIGMHTALINSVAVDAADR